MKLKTNRCLLTTLLAVTLVITSMWMCSIEVHAKAGGGFTEEQAEDAQTIADICIEHWEEYGCLPSVCIAQGWQESNLGKESNGYNWWGICSGAVSYDSLEEGVIGYMKVINNGYYEGAPFETDPSKQIRKILDGGYCQPEGEYYSNIMWIIDYFDLTQYDDQLFAALEEKEQQAELEKQKQIQAEREAREECIRIQEEEKTSWKEASIHEVQEETASEESTEETPQFKLFDRFVLLFLLNKDFYMCMMPLTIMSVYNKLGMVA